MIQNKDRTRVSTLKFYLTTEHPVYGTDHIERYEIELKLDRVTNKDHLDINLNPINSYFTIAIIGECYILKHSKQTCQSGGQIVDGLRTAFPINADVQRFCDIWERWHLGDMNAGTSKQEQFIRNYKRSNPNWKYDYSVASELLKKAGLYEDSGYEYGHNWLVEDLPKYVWSEIKELVEKFNAM